jgi:hypothetical protein
MRTTKEVTRTFTIEDKVTCDKCGQEVDESEYEPDNVFDWTLEMSVGYQYPNGELDGDKYRLDLCPECAPYAIELLINNGFKVHKY